MAGPTPRKEGIISWREQACQILEELGFDGVIYVPELSTKKPLESYIEQAEWEKKGLTNADIIVFWVPRYLPDMPGFTTNAEFGYYVKSGKVIYGRPDDAQKIRYLDWLYRSETNNEPYSDIMSLLIKAVDLVNYN